MNRFMTVLVALASGTITNVYAQPSSQGCSDLREPVVQCITSWLCQGTDHTWVVGTTAPEGSACVTLEGGAGTCSVFTGLHGIRDASCEPISNSCNGKPKPVGPCESWICENSAWKVSQTHPGADCTTLGKAGICNQAGVCTLPAPPISATDVTTYHNNNLRTGWNDKETMSLPRAAYSFIGFCRYLAKATQ